MKIQELADGNGLQAAPGDSVEFDYVLRCAHLTAAACCLLPAACCLLPAACCLLPAACCCR